MILDGMLGLIAKLLQWVGATIPSLNIDTQQFGEMFTKVVDMAKALDVILPIKEAITFGVIALGLKIALMAFWAAMRLINLIRGAG